MDYRTTDVRTGLFIAFSIAAATVLIFLMGGVRGAFRDAREVTVLFDDVRLLETEAPVTLGGFRVGEVARISSYELMGPPGEQEYKVQVVLSVNRDLDLRTDAAARVKTDGFLGKKFVALFPGMSERKLPPGTPIPGSAETDLATVMGHLEEPIARLNRILRVVEKFAGKEENVANAEVIVAETRSILERIRGTTLPQVEEMIDGANRTLGRVDKLAEDLDRQVGTTLDSARRSLEAATNTMDTLTKKVAEGVDEAGALVKELRTAVTKVSDDLHRVMAGADGLLLDNNRNVYLAVRNLRDATAELDRLLRKLRADPSVVIWGDDEKLEPPPTPPDLDALRKAGRVRRYGKEPDR